jgi:diguanylate cyclase
MVVDVELQLRTPQAYPIARRALELMEKHRVWPTATNFEIWIHFIANPQSALAKELNRLLEVGEPLTETVTEELAAAFLPKARLNDQIRDAGDLLSRELEEVAKAINEAQASNAAFGKTLETVSADLDAPQKPADIKTVVDNLATATRKVQEKNQSLEQRLAESTAEIDRLKEHLEQVRRDATTDGLTNLANRKAFDDELERACAESDRRNEPLCLAVLDIDHFKSFNDTWGHQTGDQVIRFVASVIGRVGAAPRFAARYGGEEFAMIFPSEATGVAARVLEEVREEVSSRQLKRRSTNDQLGTITLSAGMAQRQPGESGMALMERADTALYASKRGGRNRVTCAANLSDAA